MGVGRGKVLVLLGHVYDERGYPVSTNIVRIHGFFGRSNLAAAPSGAMRFTLPPPPRLLLHGHLFTVPISVSPDHTFGRSLWLRLFLEGWDSPLDPPDPEHGGRYEEIEVAPGPNVHLVIQPALDSDCVYIHACGLVGLTKIGPQQLFACSQPTQGREAFAEGRAMD